MSVCSVEDLHFIYSLSNFSFEEAERESGIQVVFRTGGVLLAQRKMEHHAKKYAEAMSKHSIP